LDYKLMIKMEFLKRRGRQPFYSVRTFAKDLRLGPMHVSYLLKGQRGLSKHNAYQIGRALGLNPRQAEKFRFLVSAQSGRSLRERNLARQALKRLR
jgi:plasmid maintenance system antidote protein VapI